MLAWILFKKEMAYSWVHQVLGEYLPYFVILKLLFSKIKSR